MNEIIMPKIVKGEIKMMLINRLTYLFLALKYTHIFDGKTLIINDLINYKVENNSPLKLSKMLSMRAII
jgi:hypothetical protein